MANTWNYTGYQINDTPTWQGEAAAAIEDVRCKAVKYDADGKIVVCSTAGEAPIGIAVITNGDNGTIAPGGQVDFQIKEIGLAMAGGAIKIGDELAVTTDGTMAPAAAGNFILGTAMETAAAGDFFFMQINKLGYKPGA